MKYFTPKNTFLTSNFFEKKIVSNNRKYKNKIYSKYKKIYFEPLNTEMLRLV